MMRGVATVLGVCVLAAGLAAMNAARRPGNVKLDWALVRTPSRKVLAEPLARATIVRTITASGKVESVEEAEIASQIIGRVIAVKFKEGDAVKTGDVLVEIDPTDAQAKLDSTKARISRLDAAINQSDSDLKKARRDADLAAKLAGRGYSTPTELADSFTALAKAEAALSMSRNELIESEAMRRASEEDVRRTIIRAPMDGVVSNINVDVGEIVIAGTTNLPGSVLMKVCDLGRMRVRADVDETDVPLVRPGQTTRVFLQSDQLRPIAGKIDRVSPQGKLKKDDVVGFETLVNLDVAPPTGSASDGPLLRPGMSVTVEVEVRRGEEALSIPSQAVVHRRRKELPDSATIREWAGRNARPPGEKARDAELSYLKVVFVLEGGVARARPIETGLSDESRVEVKAGIREDDRVVVGPFHALDEMKDGDPVVPVATTAELAEEG
ncbi:efflux RND transporter periplasmic adaptor subunit [Paludisphaera mucosa]|uniref:Efflux RND transporter periplasmic adaptor subunit n=1 Tax=Paludisphaera mucosa TaxID=3030827 RepID=A0ABT6FC93_9BACT|nr:efflux RND transporter periplasmic adaptor subunit [Paludisphaera mucosa]MDG3005206.1 efflux RND transporter periplasmic adaptor subunit [Paludisphaera mucosa]